jgi:hypothetical protein
MVLHRPVETAPHFGKFPEPAGLAAKLSQSPFAGMFEVVTKLFWTANPSRLRFRLRCKRGFRTSVCVEAIRDASIGIVRVIHVCAGGEQRLNGCAHLSISWP